MATPAGQKNIGTEDKPLLVPEGSAADLNYETNVKPNIESGVLNELGTAAPGAGIVSSSTNYRTGVDDLGKDITTLANNFGIEKPDEDFDTTLGDMTADIDKQREVIKTRKEEDISSINKGVDVAKEELGMKQEEALAAAEGRTRIGGFLTSLEVKDIMNMRRQHRLETSAMEIKRQELIQSAQRAYEDEDYKLSRDLVQEAKDLKTRIQNDKRDFLNSVLQISSESRTATKFVREEAQGKVNGILDGIKNGTFDIATLNPAEKARLLKEGGYGFDIFEATQKAAEKGQLVGNPNINTKTGEVHILIKKKDGTYEYKKVGKVTPSSTGTEAENARILKGKKASAFAEARTLFTTPGGDGRGIAGTDGKIDPANYRATMQVMAEKYGVLPTEFIKEFPPERFLSSDELKRNPDLTSSKAEGGGDEDTIEAYAQQWADFSITNPTAIPANIRDAVMKRAQEIKSENEAAAGEEG